METKFTPGEWKPFKPETSNGYVYVMSDDREEVCTCFMDRAEANAKIIAAAPRLLKALNVFVTALEPLLANPIHEKWMNEAKAAIQQAII